MTKFAEAMDRKGMDVATLSRLTNLSEGYIYKLRRGDRVPSLATAKLLCSLLGESLDIFLPLDCPLGTVQDGTKPDAEEGDPVGQAAQASH